MIKKRFGQKAFCKEKKSQGYEMRQKSGMMNRKINGLWRAAAFYCILCLGISGCSSYVDEEESVVQIEQPEENSYSLVVASVGNVYKTGKLRCTYKQIDEEEIQISGDGKTVAQVYVAEGDKVVKGQLLAELKTDSNQDLVDELEYKIARNTLLLGYTDIDESYELSGRWWTYVYQSSGSERDTEQLEASLDSIRQNYRYKREDYQDAIDLDRQLLELTLQEIEQSRIYAGIDGEISYVNPDLEGLRVLEGQTVMKIIDNTRCLFEARASDLKDADCFQEGEAVSLSIIKNRSSIDVEVIPYDMEHWEDTLYFELPENSSDIQVGTVGNIVYTIDARENVLTLPSKVIRTADGRNYVYVLGENDVREVKWIETGLWGDTMVEVISGLEEGEYVVQK